MSKPGHDVPHRNQKAPTGNGSCIYCQVEAIGDRETCSESLWEGPRGLVFRSYRMGEDSWLIWIGEKPLTPVMPFPKAINFRCYGSLLDLHPWICLIRGCCHESFSYGSGTFISHSICTWRSWDLVLSGSVTPMWIFFSPLNVFAKYTEKLAEVGTSIKKRWGKDMGLEFCQDIGLWLMNDLSVAWRRKPVPPARHHSSTKHEDLATNEWKTDDLNLVRNISGFKD